MDIFGRYLFRQLAGSFLLILVTLTVILWLASALSRLNLITAHGQTVVILLKVITLTMPALLGIIAPLALLVACIFTLDRFNSDSEIIVMSASGARIWRFATPCIVLAGMLSLCLLVFSLVLIPACKRQLHAYINQVRTDLIAQVLQPGRFTSPEDGLTFHIRDRAPNGDLLGLIINDSRAKDRTMTYLANRARIVSSDNGSYLIMKDGHIQRQERAKKDQGVQIVSFEQYIFDITQYGPKSGDRTLSWGELGVWELINLDPDSEMYKRNPGRARAELHERFASTIYPLVYIMIVINFLGHPRTVRENRWGAIVMVIGIAILLRAGGVTAMNLMKTYPSAIALVYGIPIGTIIIAAFTAHVRMASYARLRINRNALTKLQIFNNKMLAVLGVKTDQNGGRVG